VRRRYPQRQPIAEQVSAQCEFVAQAFGQRHAAERDTNDAELVAHALRLGGHFVRAAPLDGWCWVPRLAVWRPVEIKRAEVEGQAHEYTPQQVRFQRWCRDRGAPWWVWRTLDDVTRDLGGRVAA